MIKQFAWKIRIYPNKEQEILINKTLGCTRFIYNTMLEERLSVYNQLKNNKRELYEYKYKTEAELKKEYPWLSEVDSIALQQSRRDLSAAYMNFFKSKQLFPKFHKKGIKNSYRTFNVKIDFETKKIKLPKLNWISYKDKRSEIKGKICSATVSKSKTNKYFVSVLFEMEKQQIDKILNKKDIKGLDMSLKYFYVDECGNSPAYIKLYKKQEEKINYLCSILSKKKKGSNNSKKLQLKINKIFEKIANSRKDFIEKLSTDLVNKYRVIVVEDLNLIDISQKLKLGKSVFDLGWGKFVFRLKQKSEDKACKIITANKWFASSKTCSVCGYVKKDLKLGDKEWSCPICGSEHLRDKNAAANLIKYGIENFEI